jgi:hypothetical protein
MHKIGDHGKVLGASMSGLLSARVPADALPQVTVVNRDPLPDRVRPARATARSRHGRRRPRACGHNRNIPPQ